MESLTTDRTASPDRNRLQRGVATLRIHQDRLVKASEQRGGRFDGVARTSGGNRRDREVRQDREADTQETASLRLIGQDRVSGKAPPGERGALRYLLAVVPGEPF